MLHVPRRASSRAAHVYSSSMTLLAACHRSISSTRLFGVDWLENIVESNRFKMMIVILITLNALLIGFTSDLTVRNSMETFDSSGNTEFNDILESGWYLSIEAAFTITFAVECLLRIAAHQCNFFIGAEWKWNLFDLSIVLLSISEMTLFAVGFNSSTVRVLRLGRLVRSVRMLRIMRFFSLYHKLHAMTLAIVRCWHMLSCAVLIILLITYLFSVIFLTAVSQYMNDASSGDLYVDDMRTYFSSLFMTMLTLFMSVSGGVDWWVVARVLLEIHGVYVVIFLIFIVFCVLAVLNVINAIFVHDAMETTRNDFDLRLHADQDETKNMLERLTSVYREMDESNSGVIGLDDFVNHFEKQDMKVIFSLMGFSYTDSVQLFKKLDVDRNQTLSIDEFVMGCLRLKGRSILIDIDVLIREIEDMTKAMVLEQRQSTQRLECQVMGMSELLQLSKQS